MNAETNPIDQFESVVDLVYGVYLDSTSGFKQLVRLQIAWREETIKILQRTHPEVDADYLEKRLIIYGFGDPNDQDARELHRITNREYRERNSPGGTNFVFIGAMAVVSIYQYWESSFRDQIARHLNVKREELLEPVMGDLRWLRNSIIHRRGFAVDEIDRCEVLRWFRPGDPIIIDEGRFQEIVFQIKEMVDRLRSKLDESHPNEKGL